ncbi:hypothetical protein E2C01_084622 [Portunus trituberculatus]|uniref:Uncharacterized protein n=1 Tax=Portunus trituberculatus TaxID=210409 RepID=A0A5B7J9S8_PORTR|nr:hypothetical protein [Portunus trituberculatus]
MRSNACFKQTRTHDGNVSVLKLGMEVTVLRSLRLVTPTQALRCTSATTTNVAATAAATAATS